MSMFNSKIRIPTHLAIILDGNGRWATKHKLLRSVGHNEGAKRVKEIVESSFELGVKYLTVFAFSTENWKRPKEEIEFLFSLPAKYFSSNIQYFIDNKIKINILGDYTKLPIDTVNVLLDAMDKTKDFSNHYFNICLNYGGKDDIVRAAKNMAIDYANNRINLDDINENTFSNYLYTQGMPDVDLLIRTSNEKRISNFLLYQIAYAEIVFVKTLWPAFYKKNLLKVFKEYGKRVQRFGGIK